MLASELEETHYREGMRHATDSYTGEPCVNCGRNRVALRKNGRFVCEKCSWDQKRGVPMPEV